MASEDSISSAGDRAYFRVRTTLPLRATPVPDDDYQQISEEILTRVDPTIPDVDPALVGWLDRIERKLDRLLDHHGLSVRRAVDETERRAIELSGSGLSFDSAVEFEEGTTLLIEFEIPETPIRLIRCVGRVTADLPDEGRRVGVAFETIRQADRDAIVRHSLTVQRQEIRAEGQGERR